MNKYLKCYFSAIIIFCFLTKVNAANLIGHSSDTAAISIGQRVPDVFFQHLVNAPKNTARLSDYKGKAVILDFWATWCAPCVGMLPKMEQFQKEFTDGLQVILVNSEPSGRVISFFRKMDALNRIDIPCELDNEGLFDKFGVRALPHYVWIDKNGIVVAITGHEDVTGENVKKFVEAERFNYKTKMDDKVVLFDRNKPLLSGENGDVNVLAYHSVITGYLKGQPSMYGIPQNDDYAGRRLLATNVSVLSLYCMAYGGTKYPSGFPSNQVLLQIRDTSIKYSFRKGLYRDRTNLYCYELILPEKLKQRLYPFMQQDIERYFPIHGQVELRETKCLVLQKIAGYHDVAVNGDPKIDQSYYWVVLQNEPVSELLDIIRHYELTTPIVDEAGITKNISINIQAKLSDIAAVNRELAKYGLTFVFATRKLETLLLTDY